MKKLIVICICLISFNSFSQFFLVENGYSKNTDSIIKKANEKLKLKNIEPAKATLGDWEIVLKEIGEVYKTGNVLFCKVSQNKNATLTFENNQLTKTCEQYEDGKP